MGEEETLRRFCWWEEGLGLWKAEGVTQKLAVSPGWRAESQPQLPVKWGDSPPPTSWENGTHNLLPPSPMTAVPWGKAGFSPCPL